MLRSCGAMRACYAPIIAVALLLSGCGASSSRQQSVANVVSTQKVSLSPVNLLANINLGMQQTASRALGGWEWYRFIDSFGTLLLNVRYNLELVKVTYPSIGADGKPHSLTGLLLLPKSNGAAVPILMYQHGTEPYRPYSPSQFLAHLNSPTDYPEVMVAAAIASTGYAVAMADYEGMGDSTGVQPYLQGKVLAQQVIDMLRASRDIIAGNVESASSPCSWNRQLFLIGYSEGGYVTMTTTRELQLNHGDEFTVTASAPLSGPHDLSGVMRGVMLQDTPSKAPYFLPFVLSGYNYAYGGALFSPSFAMTSPFNSTLPTLFNGATPSDKISEAMGMAFDPVQLVVPKTILTQQFLDQLADNSSSIVQLLKENDSYRGWVPNVPIRMFHHRNDDLVPYENSQVAFDAFSSAGAKQWVSLVQETVTIDLSSSPEKTIHSSAAFPELSNGWQWLDTFRK